MIDDTLSFETLRASLQTLEVPAGQARNLRWIAADQLGVAKSSSGDFEIFLLGSALIARSSIVRRHLEHGSWQRTDGGHAFDASRIVLPSAPHYAAVAALIATELMRAGLGAGRDAQQAFGDVEPIIELAIRRGALPEETVLGLYGELLVLLALLQSESRTLPQKARIIGGWRGWQQGRDFVFGAHSIEVKATCGLLSTHAFNGLHQVEEQMLPDGDTETLHVLSIGLQEVPEGGQSLPELIESLLWELRDSASADNPSSLQAQLLAWIEQYGGSGSSGYRHETMANWTPYQSRFAIVFTPRLYRIADEAMKLLRRSTVDNTFLLADSMRFDIAFPTQISPFNPANDWLGELSAMASRSW